MQVLELRRPLDKKGEKREKIKRRRRRFLNVVGNRLKTIFEVVLNFTNYVIGISSGHLVFDEYLFEYWILCKIYFELYKNWEKRTISNNNVLASWSSLTCQILNNIYCCFLQAGGVKKSKQIFNILNWTRPNGRATKTFLSLDRLKHMSSLSHIQSVLIGVEYRHCHRTLDIHLRFATWIGQIQWNA